MPENDVRRAFSVQDRHRLYRDLLSDYLACRTGWTPTVPIATPVATPVREVEVERAAPATEPAVVVYVGPAQGEWLGDLKEADAVEVDPQADLDDVVDRLAPGTAASAGNYLLGVNRTHPEVDLTERELRVLALLGRGLTLEGVATNLGITARAVERAKVRAFARLGAHSQAEAVAAAIRLGYLGGALTGPSLRPVDTAYQRPSVRSFTRRRHLPSVLCVHPRRIVAAYLDQLCRADVQVVGDTVYGSVAVQLTELLEPDVIVAGGMVDDGPIEQFLPALAARGSKVVVLDDTDPGRLIELVALGADGVCRADDDAPTFLEMVRSVVAGDVSLPPALLATVVNEWRSSRGSSARRDPTVALTSRELEVLETMADGLSTKAIARTLKLSNKTVESHKTRIFSKLGVRNQSELVAVVNRRAMG